MAPRCRSSNKASRRRVPTAKRSTSRVSAATSRAGTYTLRQDLAQLPAEPAGGHWEFTGVECDGATATVDASTATATITLEAGAAATCTVTDTWVADAETASPTTAPASDDQASAAAEPPVDPDDVVAPHSQSDNGHHPGNQERPCAQVRRRRRRWPVRRSRVYASEAERDQRDESARDVCHDAAQRSVHHGRLRVAPARATSGSARSPRPPGTSGSTRSAREPRARRATTRRAGRTWSGSTSRTTRRYTVPPDQPLSAGGTEARAFANGLNNPQAAPTVRVERGDGLRRLVVHQRFRDDRDEERGADVRHRPHRHAVADRDVLVRHGRARRGRSGQPAADAGRDRQRAGDELHQRPARQSQQREQPHQLGRGPLPGRAEPVALRHRAHAHRRQPDGLGSDRRPCAGRLGRQPQVVAAGIEEAVASANAVKNEGTPHSRHRHRAHEPAGRQPARDLGPGRRVHHRLRRPRRPPARSSRRRLCQGTVTVVKEAQAARPDPVHAGRRTGPSTTSTATA